jgi:hypothetical protein
MEKLTKGGEKYQLMGIVWKNKNCYKFNRRTNTPESGSNVTGNKRSRFKTISIEEKKWLSMLTAK